MAKLKFEDVSEHWAKKFTGPGINEYLPYFDNDDMKRLVRILRDLGVNYWGEELDGLSFKMWQPRRDYNPYYSGHDDYQPAPIYLEITVNDNRVLTPHKLAEAEAFYFSRRAILFSFRRA